MDFRQIRERIDALIRLGGWTNTTPEPDLAWLAHEGLKLFNQETHHNIEDITITTVADQQDYSLVTASDTREWIDLYDDAYIVASTSGTWISKTTRDQLRIDDRLWRVCPSGTPDRWFWSGPTQIGLYPTPSTAGTEISFQGPRHEAELDGDADEPTAPSHFHEAICLYGAWLQGKLFARGEERNVAKEYLQEARALTLKYRQVMASQEAGLIQRRIARPTQEYLASTGRQTPRYLPW